MEEDKAKQELEPLMPRRTRMADSRSTARKSRLSVMPLAVLLPPVGSISELSRLAPGLQRRLVELQQGKSAMSVDESEEQTHRASEESMLNQVMLWLTSGEGER